MADRLIAQEVFGFLRPEQIHAISEASEKVAYKAGDIVYEKGAKADYIYTILTGEVTLRLPGRSGVNIVIDQLAKGAMFGSCVCLRSDAYALTASCTENSELLKIDSVALKNLMDGDLMMGYALATRLSEIYFGRYIETMEKLQAIVMNIPIEAA
jgi:NitT/TauT family transport system permease protein